MARELGVSEHEAANGAEALLRAIVGGFGRQAQAHPAGAGRLPGLPGGGTMGTAAGGNASGLGGLLDMSGDGIPLDDILRKAGAALR